LNSPYRNKWHKTKSLKFYVLSILLGELGFEQGKTVKVIQENKVLVLIRLVGLSNVILGSSKEGKEQNFIDVHSVFLGYVQL